MSNPSLYGRLGGEEKMRSIATDLLAFHKQNPAISTRDHNAKKADAEIIDLVVDLLGSATGGPQQYAGMDVCCSAAEQVGGGLRDDTPGFCRAARGRTGRHLVRRRLMDCARLHRIRDPLVWTRAD